MLLTQFHEARIPSDKIYGLLGLLTLENEGERVLVDYSTNSSEVYRQAWSLSLSTTPQYTGDLFPHGENEYVLSGIPSWVPNLSKKPNIYIPFYQSTP